MDPFARLFDSSCRMDASAASQTLLTTFAADDATLARDLHGVLSAVEAHRLFDGRLHASDAATLVIQKWVKKVNSLLLSGDAAARWCGLSLLRAMLRQCTPGIFAESAAAWMTATLQILKRPADPHTSHRCAIEVGSRILTVASHTPDQRRDMAASHVARFVASCVDLAGARSPSSTRVAAIAALSRCLTAYPGVMRPHVDGVEAVCITSVFDACPSVARAARECLARVPAAASAPGGQSADGSQSQGGQHTASTSTPQAVAWRAQLEALVAYLNETFESAHASVPKSRTAQPSQSRVGDRLRAAAPIVAGSPSASYYFEAAAAAASEMLLSDATFLVSVPVEEVMGLSTRVLAWDDRAVGGVRGGLLDIPALAMGRFHNAALSLVQALVVSCGGNAMPYASSIWRMCSKALSATRGPGTDREKGRVRAAAYDCARAVTIACGPAASVATIDEFVSAVVNDVRVAEDDGAAGEAKEVERMRPGKRRKLEEASAPIAANSVHASSAHIVALKALESIPVIVNAYAASIPAPTRRGLESTLVGSATAVQRCQNAPAAFPGPYSQAHCRAALVGAMGSTVAAFSSLSATRVHAILALIRSFAQDPSLEVRAVAEQCLVALDAMVHPLLPVPRRNIQSDNADEHGKPEVEGRAENAPISGGGFGARGLGWSAMQPTMDNTSLPVVEATGEALGGSMEGVEAKRVLPGADLHAEQRFAAAPTLPIAQPVIAQPAVSVTPSTAAPFFSGRTADTTMTGSAEDGRVPMEIERVPAVVIPRSPATTAGHHTDSRKRTVAERDGNNTGAADSDDDMPEIVDEGPDQDD